MANALENWIVQQRAAIMDYAKRWGTVLVAVSNRGNLKAEGRIAQLSNTIAPLPRISLNKALVHKVGPMTSLWVDPKAGSYRDYYRRFLDDVCGIDSGLMTRSWDVDHLYNKERAKVFGYAYVRMFPVSYSANRSHGGAYEAGMTDLSKGRSVKIMRSMDTVSMLKLHDGLAPSGGGTLDAGQRSKIAEIAGVLGVSTDQVQQEITNMMARSKGG